MRLKTQTIFVRFFAAWIYGGDTVFNFPDYSVYDVSGTILYTINLLNPHNKLSDITTPQRRKLRHREDN